jgi:MFS family permease
MFLYGAVAFIVGIVWVLTIREDRQDESGSEIKGSGVSFKDAFRRIAQTRDVWFMVIGFTGIMSCILPVMGYLAVYFENIGMEKSLAHTLVAVNFASAAVGNILLPAISDRIGLRKPIYLIAILIGCTSIFLIQMTRGIPLWLAVFGQGIGLAGAYSLSSTMVVQIKGIGHTYAGTALGVIMTIANLIAFISPIIGGALAEISPGWPFILWAGLPLLGIITIIFVKETGSRVMDREVEITANDV